MPRPRSPAGYPIIYSQIIESVSSSGQEFHHECKDMKAAQLLRFSLYDYLKALRKSPIRREKELAEQAAGLMFCVRDQFLVVKPRDTTEEVLGLTESLSKFQQDLEPAQELVPLEPMPSNPPPLARPAGPSQDDLVAEYMKGGKKE